jgi:hypothetical protein
MWHLVQELHETERSGAAQFHFYCVWFKRSGAEWFLKREYHAEMWNFSVKKKTAEPVCSRLLCHEHSLRPELYPVPDLSASAPSHARALRAARRPPCSCANDACPLMTSTLLALLVAC